MTYNPALDFLGLWRNSGGAVSKLEMPGLDFVISALARAGVINLTVSATAPVANQSTTAWLRAAVPSYSAEGAFFLWDKATTAYLPATAALFLQFLEASAGETGTSWFTTVGGAPLNTVGANGDFAIRTDEPGGIYGPKTAGAWPASPIAGTTDTIGSTQLDLTFGTAEGQIIVRGAAVWQSLGIGAANTVLASSGIDPEWQTLSALFDLLFSTAQGSVLYRDAGLWQALAPGVADQVLATGGAGANPAWTSRTAEFPPGTVMVFRQTFAPPGWTKQVAVDDCGLRVTSGFVGTVPGSGFSAVFAQTAVGGTAISIAQMPPHDHPVTGGIFGSDATLSGTGTGAISALNGATLVDVGNTGGGATHSHSVDLALAYVDVILASKD